MAILSKSIFILFSLSISIQIYAGLENVKLMKRVSYNNWEVTCENDRQGRITTVDIINNEVCLAHPNDNYSKDCFKAAIKPLNRFEYDDLEEVHEIKRACRGSNFEVSGCLKASVLKLGVFEVDDRNEVIQVIKSCIGSRGHMNKCVSLVSKGLGVFEDDNRNEVMEIIRACRQTDRRTLACIGDVIRISSSTKYDDRKEVLKIIRFCK